MSQALGEPDVEIREAMAQISEIRQQMARTTVFRGYRSVPVAFSGCLAILAAGLQSVLLPQPTLTLSTYLALWLGTAVLSFVAAGTEMAYRFWRTERQLQRELTLLVVEQFLPCVVAGSMLTAVIVHFAPQQAWMLPGLWSVVYSLGIFASYRLLPPATFWVAVYYLLTGGVCLVAAQGIFALSPWTMAGTFGIGQLLAAALLYWNLERNHG
jgi:hypothetical protein